MIDLDAVRAQTPGCLDHVFLDSAGSSLPARPVVDAMIDHLRREAEVGGYRAAAERADDLAALPGVLGSLIGAEGDLIALTDSATRAWNQFVTAIAWAAGDRILIGGNEYASNAIALLQLARVHGCTVEVIPSDTDGRVDLDALAAMVDQRVRLISLVHVATNSGRVNPVRQVVEIARSVGSLVILDACQSLGQLALDVENLGVDALSATGRKWLRGPRGTGFLYVRRSALTGLEPMAADLRGGTWTAPDTYQLHSGATRFELWESDVAGRLGLKVAAEQLLSLGTSEVEAAVRSNAAVLRAGLGALPGIRIRDDGPDLGGIVTFTLDSIEPAEVRDRLRSLGITVSVSEVSSTLVEMTRRGLPAVVRASPHYFVSPEQLDQAVAAVGSISAAG